MIWPLVRMWWVVQLLRWYGPIWKRHQKQLRISREWDANGTHQRMIQEFGLDEKSYGRSLKGQAALEDISDNSEPKVRRETIVAAYLRNPFVKCWSPDFWDIASDRHTRWRSNAERAINLAKSRKHRLIDEGSATTEISLTVYGTQFGILHLFKAILGELEPIAKRVAPWKQLLFWVAGGSSLLALLLKAFGFL